ncbi:hypothetical protein ACFFUT_12515 [Pseudohalocynthiibacter aestuariivivens]|uniref:Uncharacterized protein n=1 Tax=Pseudohalocynthiibacter aestuariivivens TaxID=1591409 RepID=A0ABV5JHM1_9RHOB|nr:MULTISPECIES: hypothetical protein [Pseudohalocynthiibacter]MBS9718954.1 hypothetical protein [Pseudohalocynthiibacter aestuariivivens]MCK0103552.1 hypothetical protein [Pseudohalocynthiibacter sp. F2068]
MRTRSRSPKKAKVEQAFPIRIRVKVPEDGYNLQTDFYLIKQHAVTVCNDGYAFQLSHSLESNNGLKGCYENQSRNRSLF